MEIEEYFDEICKKTQKMIIFLQRVYAFLWQENLYLEIGDIAPPLDGLYWLNNLCAQVCQSNLSKIRIFGNFDFAPSKINFLQALALGPLRSSPGFNTFISNLGSLPRPIFDNKVEKNISTLENHPIWQIPLWTPAGEPDRRKSMKFQNFRFCTCRRLSFHPQTSPVALVGGVGKLMIKY